MVFVLSVLTRYPAIRDIGPFANNLQPTYQIMAEIQAQVEASALLPDSQPNDPQPTKDPAEDCTENGRSVVPYLLENSPEFRELSDLRQKASHTEL